AEMSSNYPLVRLVDADGNVLYARTFNWSNTGVATGDTPVSTYFTLPDGISAGTYSLAVVANGIASDPVDFTVGPNLPGRPAHRLPGEPSTAPLAPPGAPAAFITFTPATALAVRPAATTDSGGEQVAAANRADSSSASSDLWTFTFATVGTSTG